MLIATAGLVHAQDKAFEMLKPQSQKWGLGWALDGDIFFHEGSSGTLAWANRKSGVIGILFTQFRNKDDSDARLRNLFKQAVSDEIRGDKN